MSAKPETEANSSESVTYLYYIERHHPPGCDVKMLTDDRHPQEIAESLFEDPAVMRVYQLVRLYAIGKVRGE